MIIIRFILDMVQPNGITLTSAIFDFCSLLPSHHAIELRSDLALTELPSFLLPEYGFWSLLFNVVSFSWSAVNSQM